MLSAATCAITAEGCLETSDLACVDLHYNVFHNKRLQELNTRKCVGIILQFTTIIIMLLVPRFYFCFPSKLLRNMEEFSMLK